MLRSLAHILIRLFIFLWLRGKSSLYISDNSLLSVVSFANMFPQFVAYLLILLMLAFEEQKFLILMKHDLSIIYFMDHVFGGVSKKGSLYITLLENRGTIPKFL